LSILYQFRIFIQVLIPKHGKTQDTKVSPSVKASSVGRFVLDKVEITPERRTPDICLTAQAKQFWGKGPEKRVADQGLFYVFRH